VDKRTFHTLAQPLVSTSSIRDARHPVSTSRSGVPTTWARQDRDTFWQTPILVSSGKTGNQESRYIYCYFMVEVFAKLVRRRGEVPNFTISIKSQVPRINSHGNGNKFCVYVFVGVSTNVYWFLFLKKEFEFLTFLTNHKSKK